MRRLILFDIDGTLVLSGGAGSRALTRALDEVFGLANGLEGVRLNGQTDPQIVEDALRKGGIVPADEPDRMAKVEELYLKYLADEMVVSQRARVLPGVRELLPRLRGVEGITLGLLTGNFEVGARIKLARFDLNHYFEVGAFGSDAKDRTALVPLALERAGARYNHAFSTGEVVIVGDTERDVACGKAHGVATVAVATGGVEMEELVAAGADRVFGDLAQSGVFETLTAGVRGRAKCR
jgi:phosphoglycolate phosphatase-like HAD superfamily hydrolase